MNTDHLTDYEQEEYLLDQRTPQTLRHLAECAPCREKVARLQQVIATFQSAAIDYTAQTLAARPDGAPFKPVFGLSGVAPALRWAFAAVLLVLALVLLPLHLSRPRPATPAAPLSDDALLDQVDEQLSVAVPSSMESLTHLVSTSNTSQNGSRRNAPEARSKPNVQSN